MKIRPTLAFLAAVGFGFGSAAVAAAQPRPSYGTSSTTIYTVNAWDFGQYTSGGSFTANGDGARWSPTGTFFTAAVNLPAGASVFGVEVQGCDTSATAGIDVTFWRAGITSGVENITLIGSISTGDAAAPGCGFFPATFNPHTVDNLNYTYFLQVITSANDMTTRFQAIRLRYQLQVSPAPATATFTDVPVGSGQHRFVEALVAAGITAGCGGGNFCPNQPVTRGQMAVFLSVALGLQWPN